MGLVGENFGRNKLLEWFPFYVHRIAGDFRYRALKDFQQAWFMNLLFAAWVSERPGYLRDDGQLWRLANARTRRANFHRSGGAFLCHTQSAIGLFSKG